MGAAWSAPVACSVQHCENSKGQVGTICHQTGSALIYIPSDTDPNEWCFCKCSCVAGTTLVESSAGEYQTMESLKAGDTVLALQSDGSWQSAPVVSSDGLGDSVTKTPFAIYLTLENGTVLITTPDHLFMRPDKSLIRADRLAVSDTLALSSDSSAVKVASILVGDYYGTIWNITATSETSTSSPYGHLINTAGVVSADWLLQQEKASSLTSAPQIGTKEYRDKHINFMSQQTGTDEVIAIDTERGYEFRPYRPVDIPADAIPLLPDGADIAKPAELHPLDYTVPHEMAEYLMTHYKTYYPDIQYQVDWLNDKVNAVAFIRGGQRYVVLYGGLLRHHRIQVEGAGLVIAHEIGHHYGGTPRYPDNRWASCEGQADYWAAKIAQRKVWWGEYAIEQTTKGAQQLYDLFSNGLMLVDEMKNIGVCSHPPAQCRYDTYMAGLRIQPKPACAGDPSSTVN